MAEQQPSKASVISSWVVIALLAGTGIASLCLWIYGDWENYTWGLKLTLRILWGVWIVVALATILTRVTIFGWSFRRYLRWAGDQMPAWTRFRPTKAPWSKSGKASFSFTVALVSLFGLVCVASVVMYILIDVTGSWVFWLVIRLMWGSFWVLAVVLVLVRVAIFGVQRQRALREKKQQQTSLVGSESAESSS
jgi:hypothetical protein